MTSRLVLAAMAAAAISVAATGCGRASPAAGPTVTSVPAITSTAATAPGVPATTTTVAAPAAPDLSAVQSDEQAVQAGTNQSDADFGAGTSAQSQSDQP